MFWIILGIILIFGIAFVLIYNSLIGAKNRVENAWSQILVQTKRRYDLIPNLVETVKGYAKHEKEIFTEVAKCRENLMKAQSSPKELAKANADLSSVLKSVFAIAENYPNLRASENFKALQEELAATETKIAYARQYYNDAVLMYNNAIQQFPGNLFAGFMGLKQKEYYEVPVEETKAVKVKF
ncbi:MAG: LemA family protein [archaeon]